MRIDVHPCEADIGVDRKWKSGGFMAYTLRNY